MKLESDKPRRLVQSRAPGDKWSAAGDGRNTLGMRDQNFRILFEQSIDAIYIVAPDGTSIEANQAWLDLFGYTRHELLSLRARDFYAAPTEREDFLRRITQHGVVRDEARMRRKDGTTFDCERCVVALKDDSGAIVAFQGVHRDITERRRAEEALRRSESYTRSVLDALPIGVAVNSTDPAVKFEYMNDNFPRFYRTTREALSAPDAFWEAVYQDADFRTQIRKRVLDGCASGDPAKMRWQDVPITRRGEHTTYVTARNSLIPERELMLSTVWDVTHRVESEQSLLESEHRFRSLFEHSLDGIMLVTAAGTILDANQAWLDMFQYCPDDLAKLTAGELYPNPADREDLVRRLAGSGAVRDEAQYKRRDGSVFTCRRAVTPLKDDSGNVVLYQSVVYDITELQLAAAAERRQRVFAEALMETSPACILVYDAGAKVIYANAETDRVLGVSAQQLLGKQCGEELHLLAPSGSTLPEGELPACRVYRTEMPLYAVEHAADLPVGRRVLSISAAPLFDENGNVISVVSTIEDVTARNQAERALRDSEARYRALFERSLDIILLVNLDGRIADANPATSELLGYPLNHLVGLPVWTYLRENERPLAQEMLATIRKTGEHVRLLELHPTRADGKELSIEASVSLWQREECVVGIEITARDVTERKLREAERMESISRRHQALLATVEALVSAVEMRDPYTAGHQSRVTKVSVAIARELGLADDSVEALHVAAEVHDLGKLRLPSEILTKPGRLTDIELQLIKEHPQATYDLLKGIDFPWPVAQIAYQHHERIDGSGYPRGLKGEEMLPEARILAVADVFEAMSSHRPYRPALGPEAALEELERGRDALYDGDAVRALIRLVRYKGFSLGVAC